MRVSASIQLAWEMAGREAVAGNFDEIAPEHFCLSLLKLSELPVDEAGKIDFNAGPARELATEVRALRREIESRSIDSTEARRELRRRLGSGGKDFEGGDLHRSPESRRLFDATVRRLDDAGGNTLEPVHLFIEIMEAPSAIIAEVFSSAVGPSGTDVRMTPALDAFAADLTSQARGNDLADVEGRDAECQAVLSDLARPDGGCIFLITDSDPAARAVVQAVAHGAGNSEAPKGVGGIRIMDATALVPYGSNSTDTIDQLREGLREASEASGVVVVLPAIQAPNPEGGSDPWADLVATVVTRGSPRCIGRFTQDAWDLWVDLDPAWKQRGQVVWVQEEAAGDIPWEL
jgi:ATP-dependent Clp protease ATP-binding subunit ClpA